jgi:hypothetical protein
MKLHAERQVRAHRNGGSVSVVLPRWFAAPGDKVILRREAGNTLSLRKAEPEMKTLGDFIAEMRRIGGPPIRRSRQPPMDKRPRLL